MWGRWGRRWCRKWLLIWGRGRLRNSRKELWTRYVRKSLGAVSQWRSKCWGKSLRIVWSHRLKRNSWRIWVFLQARTYLLKSQKQPPWRQSKALSQTWARRYSETQQVSSSVRPWRNWPKTLPSRAWNVSVTRQPAKLKSTWPLNPSALEQSTCRECYQAWPNP